MITFHHFRGNRDNHPTRNIACELAKQVIGFYGPVRPAKAGISVGSCNAALAITPNTVYPAVKEIAGVEGNTAQYTENVLDYGIAFGNSQIAMSKVDLGKLGKHAERCALTAAAQRGATPYTMDQHNAVLYVELDCCGPCHEWLNGRGDSNGIQNPFQALIDTNEIHLHIWTRWEYPGLGIQKMYEDHRLSLEEQLENVNQL